MTSMYDSSILVRSCPTLTTAPKPFPFDANVSTFGRCPAPRFVPGLAIRSHVRSHVLRHRPCFGLIPAGSTNTIVWSVNGNACLTTCALRVILGESTDMDMGAVHRTGKPTVYMTNFLGYGFFGDVMKHSEGYGSALPHCPAAPRPTPIRERVHI